MTEEIKNKITSWRNFEGLEPSLRKELESLTEEKLVDAFYTDLAFGTGGLRGVMGVGTNRMNIYVIQKATYGFYLYMKEHFDDLETRGVVISYDCRHHSFDFAKAAAAVLGAAGVKVYLFSSLRPTPELSFAVRYLKCAGGIMVTASHNPPEYNGYKVYDSEGCQLVPELADEVIEKIEGIEDLFSIKTADFETLAANGTIKMIDEIVDKPYLDMVKTVKVQDVPKNNIKIVFTPLHGTASVHLVKLLREEGYDVTPVASQMIPDGSFSTVKSCLLYTSPSPRDA